MERKEVVYNQVAEQLDVQNPNVIKTLQKGIKDNLNNQSNKELEESQEYNKLNRAQRRELKKKQKQLDKKRYQMLMKYLTRHPEAAKIEIDEEAVKKIEEQEEKAETEKEIETEEETEIQEEKE